MRRTPTLPVIVAAFVVAALLGAAAAIGIAAGAGWLGRTTTASGARTVIVNARSLPASETLPSALENTAVPLPGNGFDPARIYKDRAPGVVTIFAYYGDPSNPSTQGTQGSGFVISPKGYILTNAHVITNAGNTNGGVHAAAHVYVEFEDLDRVPATVVGWDVYDDVGLIRVSASAHGLHPVPLGNSAVVQVGEPVSAIGSPLGNEDSLAVGVVSGIHRSIPALTVERFSVVDAIQTDAPITHGNSGGPLFDARGRVIGINAQIRSNSGTGNDSGIGFAIPIDAAKHSLTQLLTTGKVDYAFVGIETQDVTPGLAQAAGLTVKQGALIERVDAGGPGAAAGLQGSSTPVDALGYQGLKTGGDVVVAIDGRPVRSADDLLRIVTLGLKPGTVAAFTIVRGTQRKVVAVTLGHRTPTG